MTRSENTDSGRANAAQPLGERAGLVSKSQTKKTGKRSQEQAGPDGPNSAVVGDTFKAK